MFKLIFYFTYCLGIVMYANEVENKDQVTWDKRIDYTAYRCTSRLIVHTVPHVDKLWNWYRNLLEINISDRTMKGWPRLKDREGILGCWLGREFLEVVIKRKFNVWDMCLLFYQWAILQLWMEARLRVTLFWYKPSLLCYGNCSWKMLVSIRITWFT